MRTAEAGDRLDASCVVAVTGQELGQKLSLAFLKWNRTVTPFGQVPSVIFPWEDFLDLVSIPLLSTLVLVQVHPSCYHPGLSALTRLSSCPLTQSPEDRASPVPGTGCAHACQEWNAVSIHTCPSRGAHIDSHSLDLNPALSFQPA